MSRSRFQILNAVLLPLAFLASCEQSQRQKTVAQLQSFEPYAAADFMQLIYDLNAEQTAALLEQNQSVVIIDVRGAEAFHQSRLPGAFSYDAEHKGFRDEIGAFDREELILVYGSNIDNAGAVVANAVSALKEQGFKTIHFLNTRIGIEGWQDAGLQVERGY